jgi:DNA-binding response OmpR family regulator
MPSATGYGTHAATDRPLRVAVLDSSVLYRALLGEMVRQQGWSVEAYDRYADLVATVEAGQADVAVLNYDDVPVPEQELEELLHVMSGPTVILAEHEAQLKAALRGGATLAVQKPFDPDYLALALDAMLNRGLALRSIFSEVAQVKDLRVSFAGHTVERGGRRQVLSHTEWQLFSVLLSHPGRVFSRDELATLAWGAGYAGRRAQIELYVSRLRKKVERDPRKPEIIATVRHLGYRLCFRPHPARPAAVEEEGAAGRTEPWHSTPSTYAANAWISTYTELVVLKTALLDRARTLLASAPVDPYRSLLYSDVQLMEPELNRLRRRLTFWEGMRPPPAGVSEEPPHA